MKCHPLIAVAVTAGAMVALPSLSAAQTRTANGVRESAISIPVDNPGTKAISATLHRPDGPGPFSAVVYMQGCWDWSISPEQATRRAAVDHLAGEGVAVLIVDPLAPRSQSMEELCASITPDTLAKYAPRASDNALAAVKALKAMPEIDPNRIFLQGYAFGADAALFAVDVSAKRDPNLTVAEVIAYYPLCADGMNPAIPTLVMIGDKDDWMPAAACQSAAKDKPGVELVVYPGETHAFVMPYVPGNYQGHRMIYDETAAADAAQRADAFMAAHMK